MDGRTYGRADGQLRPTLLGRVGGVDLKMQGARRRTAVIQNIILNKKAISVQPVKLSQRNLAQMTLGPL